MRLLAAPLLAVLFSGCVGPAVLTTAPGSCTDNLPSAADLPTLYLQSDTRLHELSYAERSHTYVVTGSYAAEGTPYGVVARDHGIYASWSDRLVRLDGNLGVLDERTGAFGGIALRDDRVHVAGKGTLEVLDRRLQPVATESFTSGTYKVSHDVIVCPPYALLLDNVVSPIFTYQVDVSDKADPKTLHEGEWSCLCHLQAQWTDRAEERWYVLESGGGRGHSYQELHTYAIGTGTKTSVKTHEGYFDMWSGNETAPSQGWRVLAVAPTEPPLAIAWKDHKHWMGRLHADAEGLDLFDVVDLERDGRAAGRYADIEVRGNVAVAVLEDHIAVVHLGGERKVAHAQTLTLDDPVKHVAIG